MSDLHLLAPSRLLVCQSDRQLDMQKLILVLLLTWSTLSQAGSVCRFEVTANKHRSGGTPPVPNRLPEGSVTEASIHGQRVAGTGPGCHCLHEEAGAAQVRTALISICKAQHWCLLKCMSFVRQLHPHNYGLSQVEQPGWS